VVGAIDRHEAADQVKRVVGAQPRAGERDAQAVADDVDLPCAGVVEHGVHEAAKVGNVRHRGVAPADRLVGFAPRSHWSPW
jgi:hypothetical protein